MNESEKTTEGEQWLWFIVVIPTGLVMYFVNLILVVLTVICQGLYGVFKWWFGK